jgi:hypothetical protein
LVNGLPQHFSHLDTLNNAKFESTPEARQNPAVTRAVLDVVRYQLQLWRQMDPLLMAIQGCPDNLMQMIAALNAPPPMMGPPAPGSTSSTPPPQSGAQSVASGPDTPPIKLPSPPPDPMSGKKPPPPEMRTA